MPGEQSMTTSVPTHVPAAAGPPPIQATVHAETTGVAPARLRQHFPADLFPYEAVSGWRPWPALGIVVLIMAGSLVAAFGGGVLLLAVWFEAAGISKNAKLMLFMLAAQILMIAGTLLAARAKGGRLATVLALKPPVGGFWSYVATLLIMLATVVVYTVVASYAFSHDPSQDMADMADIFRGPWWPLALVVIGAGAPLSEELMFRGFLQTALVRSPLGYWGATVVTTSIWTALHAGYSLIGIGEVFLIGLVFAVFLRRTGSLRVTLVCHAIYNSALALLIIFGPKDLLGP